MAMIFLSAFSCLCCKWPMVSIAAVGSSALIQSFRPHSIAINIIGGGREAGGGRAIDFSPSLHSVPSDGKRIEASIPEIDPINFN